MNSETKNCASCKNSFTIEPEDFDFYKKIDVPAPIDCPQCRQQHRILFRNFTALYKRPSSKSGQSLISMYSPRSLFPVFTHEEWWSDSWDPKSYGRDIDLSKPIFPQIHALWNVVPRAGMLNVNSVNCHYSTGVLDSKNCYFVFGCVDNEDCMFGHIVWNSKECIDCLYVFKSELCYESIDVLGSYRLLYSQECEDCTDGVGLYDCKGCSHCIGCVGLRQKSYYIFNEPVTKDQYEDFLKRYPLHQPGTIQMILEKRDLLRRKLPQRHFFGTHNTDVSGNHIYNAKNVHYSFDVKGGENSKYVFTARKAIESYDISFTPDIEFGYFNLTGFGRNIYFSHWCGNSSDVYYSDLCFGSRNIFACAGLRSAEYCILNKQYTKEEYEKLFVRIKEHMKKTAEWGNFFPRSMSPFAYNEAATNDYFPLVKEQALQAGYRWEDNIPATTGVPTKQLSELPSDPALYSKDLSREILACTNCKRNYLLTPQELDFYKRLGLALPNFCYYCRHRRRMAMRNPRTLWSGTCAKCGVVFQTSYSSDKQKEFKIYCESCYAKEML